MARLGQHNIDYNAQLIARKPSLHSLMAPVFALSIFDNHLGGDTGYVKLKPNGPLIGRKTETIIEGQTPANPGIKTATFSTYGAIIPASMGRRMIAGNVIDASELVPRLVGYREYYTEERVYPEDSGGVS